MKRTLIAALLAASAAGALAGESAAVGMLRRDAQDLSAQAGRCIQALRDARSYPAACDDMRAAAVTLNATGRVVAKSEALVREADKAGAFAEVEKALELMKRADADSEKLRARVR